MRRLALLLIPLALVLGLAACGDDDGGAEGTDGGSATTQADGGSDAPGGDGSEFDDVAALRDELVANGIECELDYEGLADEEREVSQCVIEGEQAVISIWYDPALRDEVVNAAADLPQAALATGANWTVEVTSAAVAQTVADALGGEVVGGTTDQGGATTTVP
jgi:hypothetical protein